jgi:hypothetical protein
MVKATSCHAHDQDCINPLDVAQLSHRFLRMLEVSRCRDIADAVDPRFLRIALGMNGLSPVTQGRFINT